MKKIAIISVDSLFTSDLDHIKEFEGFSEILSDCVLVKNIECVYPTLTYPCHTTIISGCTPQKHGIIHNEKLDPVINNAKWFWDYRDIKVKTLFDYAKENGLKTAAFSWPVTANGPIDILLPETWTLAYEKENSAINLGASLLGEKLYQKYAHLLDWKDNLQLDTFALECAKDAIINEKPDVLFIHQATLDHARHVYGTSHEEVTKAHRLHGKWIKDIIEAYKKAGTFEDTTFIILGDHGQLDINQVVSINQMFLNYGLLSVDQNNVIQDYQAYCQSAGISAHVYVKDKSVKNQVLEILNIAKDMGYIEKIFTKEQANEMGLDGDFEFVIEGASGTSISNLTNHKILQQFNDDDYKNSKATHGHLPTIGDKPPMIIYHSQLPQQVIDYAKLVDEFPTMMKLLGLPVPDDIDGHSLV